MAIARQMIAGALMFFIFRQQTSAYYFTQIVYYGGAKYIATGRGFDLVHTPYVKTFTAFGRSHMYFGFQLGLLAVMLAFLDIQNYAASTWGTWLVAVSLTFSPLWFNPATFRIDTVRSDFEAWRRWMMGSTDKGTGQSWCAPLPAALERWVTPAARFIGGAGVYRLSPLRVSSHVVLCAAGCVCQCDCSAERWEQCSLVLCG